VNKEEIEENTGIKPKRPEEPEGGEGDDDDEMELPDDINLDGGACPLLSPRRSHAHLCTSTWAVYVAFVRPLMSWGFSHGTPTPRR